MRNIFLFALISATLFACTPIENEPGVDVVNPVNSGPDIIIDAPQYSGYTYGFYYGKTYDATVYQTGEAPATQDIVFVNDSVAVAEDATFYSVWSADGVELVLNLGTNLEESFQFYYFNELDRLICYKSEDLTIVITKPGL